MLNVTDPHSGAETHLAVRHGGFVQLQVQVGDQPGPLVEPPTVTDLRALLVADLVRRVLEEIDECQVFLTLAYGGEAMSGGRAGAETAIPEPLFRDLADLWIPVPVLVGRHAQQDRPDLVVSSAPVRGPGSDAPMMGVGAVTLDATLDTVLDAVATPVLADLVANGADPLMVRFALMRHGHEKPVSLTHSHLDEAAQTLRRWRTSVATWAGEVSQPMRREVVDDAYQALRSDLNTPRVLDLLTRLEHDPAVAAGAKFETFAHLDRFLALNLAGSLGSAMTR